MLQQNLSSCHSRVVFLLREVHNLESPPSPFSPANRFYVMKCLGENETMRERKEIAFLMKVTPDTVDYYRKHIYEELDVTTKAELIYLSQHLGYID